MEPNRLDPTTDDARLTALLRENTPPSISDHGFTANVLVALPKQRRGAASLSRRDLLLLAATVIVSLILIQLNPGGLAGAYLSIAEIGTQVRALAENPRVLIALGCTAACILFLYDEEAPEPL